MSEFEKPQNNADDLANRSAHTSIDLLHCICLLMADFVAKVFLHSWSKFLLVVHAIFVMWGTSSPEDKLAGIGNVIEAISTGGRWVGFFYSRKLAPSNLGPLQQYRHT